MSLHHFSFHILSPMFCPVFKLLTVLLWNRDITLTPVLQLLVLTNFLTSPTFLSFCLWSTCGGFSEALGLEHFSWPDNPIVSTYHSKLICEDESNENKHRVENIVVYCKKSFLEGEKTVVSLSTQRVLIQFYKEQGTYEYSCEVHLKWISGLLTALKKYIHQMHIYKPWCYKLPYVLLLSWYIFMHSYVMLIHMFNPVKLTKLLKTNMYRI